MRAGNAFHDRIAVAASVAAIAAATFALSTSAPSTRDAPDAARFHNLNPAVSDDEAEGAPDWMLAAQRGDYSLYIDTLQLRDVEANFPLQPGLTVSEIDARLEKVDQDSRDKPIDQVYILGWRKAGLAGGSGWLYYWVTGKHVLHTDIVIEDNKIKSIWVMPGNAEWVSGIYYRIAGVGPHVGPGRIW